MDESNNPQNRRSQRSNVLMTAIVDSASGQLSVKLRNLSQDGALVEADELPADGSVVIFRRGELMVEGRVVWVRGKRAGIAFDEKLSPEAVLHHIPVSKPRKELVFRRPGVGATTVRQKELDNNADWMWRPGHDLQGE